MADIKDRDEKEAKLGKAVSKEFRRAQNQLAKDIPDLPPHANDISAEFWNEHRSRMTAGMSPVMLENFILQAEDMMDGFPGIGVDWGLVNIAAADWARDYTFGLVSQMIIPKQRALQKLIAQYFDESMTQGELRRYLTYVFPTSRVATVARTEVTRAAVQGELEVINQLRRNGINMTPTHRTRMDELVCPICGPRANNVITDNVFPPLHPNCRCEVSWSVAS